MNLCDSSVWVALALAGHVHHAAARAWLETIGDPAAVLFCRATQQTLLRLLTTAAVLALYKRAPLTNREAWGVYEKLLADDRIAYRAGEPPGLEDIWKGFTSQDTASHKLWMDAYLAAFAVAGGYRLVTTDTAFRQFEGLDLLVLGGS